MTATRTYNIPLIGAEFLNNFDSQNANVLNLISAIIAGEIVASKIFQPTLNPRMGNKHVISNVNRIIRISWKWYDDFDVMR